MVKFVVAIAYADYSPNVDIKIFDTKTAADKYAADFKYPYAIAKVVAVG